MVAPSHAPTSVRTSVKRWVGVRAGWAIEPRNQGSGVPTSSLRAEGNIAGSAMREPPGGPRAVGVPVHARNLHAREPGGPRSPAVVMAGRDAQGRPRPYAWDARSREVGHARSTCEAVEQR